MKIFKKITILFIILLPVFSCNNEKAETDIYLEERDSLIQINNINKQQLEELNGIISTIATGLDSIAVQEHILFSNKDKDGLMLSRRQILSNLKGMADILARQRRMIQVLQDSLANNKSSQDVDNLQKVVEFLNQQLAEKDKVIQSLRADLSKSKKDITLLRSSLSDMSTRAEKAEKKTKALTAALTTQDDILNECYVKIGTKKELMSLELLSGGFLRKTKVNYESLDKSKFRVVDIRKFKEVHLKSRSPRILTPQPSNNSYYLKDNGDGTCTLHITNPNLFWSVSNFLIIQL